MVVREKLPLLTLQAARLVARKMSFLGIPLRECLATEFATFQCRLTNRGYVLKDCCLTVWKINSLLKAEHAQGDVLAA